MSSYSPCISILARSAGRRHC